MKLDHILKKWEDLIYSLVNIVNARKITGDLVSMELSEILPEGTGKPVKCCKNHDHRL